MSGCRRRFRRRWTTLLALGWLLLAAQQMALLHPLTHLADPAQARAHAHGDVWAADGAEPVCDLCLGCVAAAHLATAAPAAAPVLDVFAPSAPGLALATAPGQAWAAWHNRDPPAAV